MARLNNRALLANIRKFVEAKRRATQGESGTNGSADSTPCILDQTSTTFCWKNLIPLPLPERTLTEHCGSGVIQCEVLSKEEQAIVSTEPRSLEEYTTYLHRKYPHIKARLKDDPTLSHTQVTAWVEACWRILELPPTHLLAGNFQIIAPTGAGKTYLIDAVVETIRAEDPARFPLNKFILVISPPAVVAQTQQVLAQAGNLPGVLLCTLAGLRAGVTGSMFIEWKTEIVNHNPVLFPHWIPDMVALIFLDESQQIKNDSTQAMMVESAASHGIPVIPMSATPYSRPCQAKSIACVLAPVVSIGKHGRSVVLDEHIWPTFVQEVCAPYSALDWRPGTLEKLQRWLDTKTVRFTCNYPHPILTKYCETYFTSEEGRIKYMNAFIDWERKKAEFGRNPTSGFAAVLVAMQKFNQIADEVRAPDTAKTTAKMYREREGSRKRPMSYILGFAYRTAMDIALKHLIEVEGIDEKLIAVIAGGRGAANARDHQRFQRDKAHILLMTIACGGAGLSLDHNKTNRRQRGVLASCVYNDIQMAQLAGRTQRVDTQSASYLYLLFYAGTEEQRKINKVRRKMSSLSKIVTKVGVRNARSGKANVFVDDHDMIADTRIKSLELLGRDDNMTEDEQAASEDAIAATILGSQQNLNFVEDDEDNDN